MFLAAIRPLKNSLKVEVDKVIQREFHRRKVDLTDWRKQHIESLYFNKKEVQSEALNKNITPKEMRETERRKVVKACIKVKNFNV